MMTPKRLALLSVARKTIGLEEDDYRAILREHGGSASARELDDAGFDRVMIRFRQLGFVSDVRRRAYGDRPGFASPAQLERIRRTWREVQPGKDEPALERWIESHFRDGVSSLRFLTSDGARKVTAALAAWKARKASQNVERTPAA